MSPPQHQYRPARNIGRETLPNRSCSWDGDWASFAARLTVLGIVLSLPWLLGGTLPGALYGACVAITAVLALWLISLFTRADRGFAIPVAAVPLLLGVALGLFQIMPMDVSQLETVSPRAAEIWKSVPAKSSETGASAGLGTVSLYPSGTQTDTSLLVLAGTMFLLGTRFFAEERAQRWMWSGLAVNGAALACFGIVQQLTWNGKLYWTIKPLQVLNAFGPYVNHNNAAGYLSMCLGGALVLMAGQKLRSKHSAQAFSPRNAAATETGNRSGKLVGLLAGACLIAGILCSLSRGAYVALAVALVVTLLFSRQRIRLSMLPGWMPVSGILLVVLLGGLGFSESVQQRIATLFRQQTSPDSRLAHWSDAVHAIPDFPWFGSGFGTYRYVYRPYASDPGEEWFYHAENQYLEATVEGGLIGLGLMLAAVASVLWAIRHQLQQDPVPHDGWLALAALFALITQSVHGFFDFGLYLPANMLLLALICGAAAGRATRFGFFSPSYRFVAVSGPESLGVAFVVVLALLAESAFPLHEARTARAVSTAAATLQSDIDVGATDPALLEAMVMNFDEILAIRERNVDAQRTLADAWKYVYRRRVYGELTANVTQEEREQQHEELWKRSDPRWLRQRYFSLLAEGREELADQLLSHPAVAETLPNAQRHYNLAVRSCPLVGANSVNAAELGFMANGLRPDAYFPLLELVGAGEPTLMYRAGLLAAEAGELSQAFTFWRECLERSDRHLDEIVDYGLQHAPLSVVIDEVIPASPSQLVRLTRQRFAGESSAAERRLLLQRAEALLEDRPRETAEFHHTCGTVFAMKRDVERAIVAYGDALKMEPTQVVWRYELAELLQQARRIEEAREQLRICIGIEPDNTKYRQKYQQLIRQRVTL